MDYTNIPTGLKIQSQIPLNSKEWVKDEATLAYLGIDDNLAFTYHDQLEVLCLQEKKVYVWREVQNGEENTGLIPLDFTYPTGLADVYGINYSGKKYNFFLIECITVENINENVNIVNIGEGLGIYKEYNSVTDKHEFKTITKTGDLINITSNSTELNITVDENALELLIENRLNNLQKTITSNYTLTDNDDKHTIFIENGVNNVLITVPEGLKDNFYCAFYQLGDGNVQIASDVNLGSPSIFTPIGNYIKGKYYWAHLEKVMGREEYGLLATVQL